MGTDIQGYEQKSKKHPCSRRCCTPPDPFYLGSPISQCLSELAANGSLPHLFLKSYRQPPGTTQDAKLDSHPHLITGSPQSMKTNREVYQNLACFLPGRTNFVVKVMHQSSPWDQAEARICLRPHPWLAFHAANLLPFS